MTQNPYQTIIKTLKPIFEYYGGKLEIQTYGVGAIVPDNKNTSDLIALTGNMFKPSVKDFDSALHAYYSSVDKLAAAKSVKCGPLLNYVNDFVRQLKEKSQDNHQTYHILIVLTSTEMEDQQETINQLVEASKLPLSVMFI